MNYDDLISHFGSPAEVARQLGVSKQVVSLWRKGISEKRQAWIQLRTGGALLADLCRQEAIPSDLESA